MASACRSDDLIGALGTIANSGTRAFLEKIGQGRAAKARALIGHFGVGFYSVFMVADIVEVATRRAGEGEAWLWSSEGKGAYSIAPLAVDEAPPVGARVTLHLNAESDEFLEPWRIESIVREHSGAVSIADRPDRGAGQGAAPHRRRRGAVDETQIRDHAGAIYRTSTGSSPAVSTSRRSPCIGARKGAPNTRCSPSCPAPGRSISSSPAARASQSSMCAAC